jgi:hypothetical protein
MPAETETLVEGRTAIGHVDESEALDLDPSSGPFAEK